MAYRQDAQIEAANKGGSLEVESLKFQCQHADPSLDTEECHVAIPWTKISHVEVKIVAHVNATMT